MAHNIAVNLGTVFFNSQSKNDIVNGSFITLFMSQLKNIPKFMKAQLNISMMNYRIPSNNCCCFPYKFNHLVMSRSCSRCWLFKTKLWTKSFVVKWKSIIPKGAGSFSWFMILSASWRFDCGIMIAWLPIWRRNRNSCYIRRCSRLIPGNSGEGRDWPMSA